MNKFEQIQFSVNSQGETEFHPEIKKDEPKKPIELRIGGKIVELTTRSKQESTE